MFIDWLKMYQDFDRPLPFLGERACIHIDTQTGEHLAISQPPWQYEGSHATHLTIRVSGNRLLVNGNPSRINRLDNLFGYTRLADCVAVYNAILTKLGLPTFTPCTRRYYLTGKDGKRVQSASDGAIITELHITTNQAVGAGNTETYLRAIATQPYRYSLPRLLANGQTVDWMPPGSSAPSLIYPSMYNKGYELGLHLLPQLKRRYGADSPQYRYAQEVQAYCQQHGVVRAELKLKSRFLRRQQCRYYGLFNETTLTDYLDDFINLDHRLVVNAMTIETINQTLLRHHIVSTTHAANTTACYALRWMHGERFDLAKSAVKKHRARLRRIGIDIAQACDVASFSPVRVTAIRELTRQPLAAPAWYRQPPQQSLRLVA